MRESDNVAIVTRKKLRGAVLCLLEDSYPHKTPYQTLEHVLAVGQKCQAHELRGIIKYLQDKGYINVILAEEPELKPLENSLIELSAHGVDLLEGSLGEDPGIII